MATVLPPVWAGDCEGPTIRGRGGGERHGVGAEQGMAARMSPEALSVFGGRGRHGVQARGVAGAGEGEVEAGGGAVGEAYVVGHGADKG